LVRKTIEEVLRDIILLIQEQIDHEIQWEEQDVRRKIVEIYFFKINYLVTGRGRLYYWGPNHAGDPVVTR
jgi:hypothetical protein